MALGLRGFVESQKGWVGAIFLLSGSLLLSLGVFSLYELIRAKVEDKVKARRHIDNLKYLSPLEKEVLERFIHSGEHVLRLPVQDPAVIALEQRNVLLKRGTGSTTTFTYMIQPCVFFHIKDHPEILNR